MSSSFQGFLLLPSSPPSLLLSSLQCHVAYCCHCLCFGAGSIVPRMGQLRICSQERGATDAYGSCRNVTGLCQMLQRKVPNPEQANVRYLPLCPLKVLSVCPRSPRVSDTCTGVTVAVLKPTAVGAVSLPDPVPSAGSTAGALGRAAPSCSRGKARSSTATEGPGGQAVLTSCGLCCEHRGLPCPGLSRRHSV